MVVQAATRNDFKVLCLIERAEQARVLGQIAEADRLLLLAWMAYDDAVPPAADPPGPDAAAAR